MMAKFLKCLLPVLALCGLVVAVRGEAPAEPPQLLPGAAGGESAARWLWFPESIPESVGQKRYFLKEIELPSAPVGGGLNFAADDVCVIWINGVQRGHCGIKGVSIPAKHLRAGKNLLALRGWNARGPAGVLMRGEIALADGGTAVVVTDRSWRCTESEVVGWNRPGFRPGAKWVAPADLRGVNASHVWREFIKRENFLSREEIAEANREVIENDALTKRYQVEVPRRLAAEKTPTVRIAARNGVSGFLIDEVFFPALIYKAAAIRAGAAEGRERIRRYAAAGFHVYQISATQANDFHKNVDHKIVEERFLGVLGADPEARLIVGIGLDPSPEWGRNNPDEVVGYGSGRNIVPGSDAMRGTPLLPSFASLKWRKEAGDAVRKLIRELEASPYGKRIIGYQFNYGVYSEWHSFGMWNNLPDTGAAMTAAYRRFLKKKYGTDAALRQAWGDPAATLAHALPPAPEKRLNRTLLSLRDPAAEREVLDFDACQAEEVNAAQRHFGRIAKEETRNRKVVGFYSGYFFGNGFPVSAWQPKTPEVLQSEFVDYQASPYAYGQRRIGLTSLPRSVIDTYPLQGKLGIFESDTRPHFLRNSPEQKQYTHLGSTADDIAALSRDFAQAFTHGAGFWLYDFSLNNWFARPELLPLLHRFASIAHTGFDCTRTSEVALICDFGSVPLQHSAAEGNPLPSQLCGGNAAELCYAGAPYDAILTEDLLAGRAKDYRLYIFANHVRHTPELEKLAAEIRAKGKTLLWLYAPGLLSERGADVSGIARLTGFRTGMIRERLPMGTRITKSGDPAVSGLAGRELPSVTEGPVFFIDDPEAQTLGTWDYRGKSRTTFAAKRIGKSLSFYCTSPRLDRVLFRNLMKCAGVHLYTPDTEDVLFANQSLAGIHTLAGGEKTLRLPRRARRITRVLPDEAVVAENTDTLRFTAPKGSTALFHIEY